MLPIPGAAVTFGPFSFDRTTRLLRRGDAEVPLPPRVLGVLELLLSRAGEIVPRQQIIDAVWKDAFVTDTSLAEAISFLRQALGDDPQAPTYIQTVHRRGYRFVAPVVEPPAARSDFNAAVETQAQPEVVSPSIGGALVPWTVATICALLAIVAVWQFVRRDTTLPPVVRILVEPPPGTTLDTRAPALAISPDGHRVVFAACEDIRCRLYARDLDSLATVELGGTDDASAPFFSPDGRWVGFFAGGKLKKIATPRGAPVILADAPHPFGAAWLPDGNIVFADSRFAGLKRVSDDGGTPTALTDPAPGELGHAWPTVLPDGRAIMFTASVTPVDGGAGPIAIVPYEPRDPTGARTPSVIVGAADSGRAVTAEYIAYTRHGDLYAVPFDRTRLAPAGSEQPVVEFVAPLQFAVSASGALVHGAASRWRDSEVRALGSETHVPIAGIAHARAVALSPDGRRVAVLSKDDAASDIWVMDLERGATTRLTHGGINVAPVWSADGGAVYYASRGTARFEIWRRDTGATSPAVRVASRQDAHLFPSSAAGDRLVLTAAGRGTSIWTIAAAGGPAALAVDSAFDDVAGVLSPAGRLVAYQSDESGRWEVNLLRLADKRRTAVSTGGGEEPFWSRDGRTLYYTSGGRLMSAAMAGDEPGPPAVFARLPPLSRPIGIGADGIVRLTRDGTPRPSGAVLTLEWSRELRQLLGPPGTVLIR